MGTRWDVTSILSTQFDQVVKLNLYITGLWGWFETQKWISQQVGREDESTCGHSKRHGEKVSYWLSNAVCDHQAKVRGLGKLTMVPNRSPCVDLEGRPGRFGPPPMYNSNFFEFTL